MRGGGGFDVSDLFGGAAQSGTSGFGGGIGDLFGNIFGRRGWAGGGGTRPQRGTDVETEVRIDFVESVKGVTVPLRLSSPRDLRHLPRVGREAGHLAPHLPDLQRRGAGQPQPGRVRVQRAVPRLPRHRPRSSTTRARSAAATA